MATTGHIARDDRRRMPRHPSSKCAHPSYLCSKVTNAVSVKADVPDCSGHPCQEKGASMLLERELIQSVGFRNVREGGHVTGFQLRLRMPSYRGMAASLIDGVSVRVGGLVDVAPDVPLWTIAG